MFQKNYTNTGLQDSNIKFTSMSIFRPPVIRSAGAILDRSLFSKTIPISAARIRDNKNISNFREKLRKSGEILVLERIQNVRQDADGKCILLKPEVKHEGRTRTNVMHYSLTKSQIPKHGVLF